MLQLFPKLTQGNVSFSISISTISISVSATTTATDLKEILQVTDKERSQVADILHVLKESKCEKEKEQMGVMFLVQSALRETKSAPGEWLYNKI